MLKAPLLVVTVALALLLAACGGGAKSADSGGNKVSDDQKRVASYCAESAKFEASFVALTETLDESAESEKKATELVTAGLNSAREKAPSEIKADIEAFAKIWAEYAAILKKANYDVDAAAKDKDFDRVGTALEAFDMSRVEAWEAKNCTGLQAGAPAAPRAGTTPAGMGRASSAAFCAQVAKLMEPPTVNGATSPAEAKKVYEQYSASINGLADKAPPELKADLEAFAKNWRALAAIMKKANYDPMKAMNDKDFLPLATAMNPFVLVDVLDWREKNCPNAK